MSTSLSQTPTAEDAASDWGPLSALPGNPLMWVLIASELAVFGAALIGYAGARWRDPIGFALAQNHLDRVAGLLDTAVLLTSGLFAALALESRREGARAAARAWLAGAFLFGVVFLIVKGMEYARLIDAGFDLDSGGFFTVFYLVTGFHALHVVLGLVILALVARFDSFPNYQTGAAFWHMVDLIWIVVFPILFLLR
ncbi:MAG: cytochrome c oxidase subunit 3 [Pseudomonadota bacterium]|nr:cytochrome c oxidase subunit 3 [Pseudomonadota bacterium]